MHIQHIVLQNIQVYIVYMSMVLVVYSGVYCMHIQHIVLQYIQVYIGSIFRCILYACTAHSIAVYPGISCSRGHLLSSRSRTCRRAGEGAVSAQEDGDVAGVFPAERLHHVLH